MTRLSICLVGAALAAAACGDDTTSSSGNEGGGGNGATSTSSTTTTSSPSSSGATNSAQSSSGQGTGGEGTGGEGTGGEGTGGEGTGGEGVAPPFRTEVDMADDDLALRALQIVGADVEGTVDRGKCGKCHALTEGSLGRWNTLTNGVLDECLTDLAVTSQASAVAMIECVRDRALGSSGNFDTPSVGFWAAGANRDWWKYTFQKAYPEDGEARFVEFVSQVKMPKDIAYPPLTSDEYDVVGEWFVRGAPFLHELLHEPIPGECEPLITDDIAEYVAERENDNWRTENASAGILMYGCEGDEDAIDCLSDKPEVEGSWHVTGQGSIKRLFTTNYESAFWTRGSADGRFVGHGGGSGLGSSIIDLQDNRVIPVNAQFDPGFFPDNEGFIFQTSGICPQDVLTSDPDQVMMNEPGCSDVAAVDLYQHVGAGLDGGDYFAVDGPFTSDNGGHQPTLGNPMTNFGAGSAAGLIPMVFTGSGYQAVDEVSVSTPNDGDAVISPTAGLLLSRSDGTDFNAGNSGYRLRKLEITENGGNFAVDATVIGNYCISGGKPAFSYDERWVVLHHYIEDTDEDAIELGFTGRDAAGFAAYRNSGAANIFLLDVTTGEKQRITNMPAGSYALFPFFRSDGWIYFMVRTSAFGDGELVLASDAALRAED